MFFCSYPLFPSYVIIASPVGHVSTSARDLPTLPLSNSFL